MKTLHAFAIFCLLIASPVFAQHLEEKFTAMNPEQKRAFEVEVMEKVADLALIPPKLNTSPLPKYDYDQLAYGMTIGISRTPGGRLWACWVAGEDGFTWIGHGSCAGWWTGFVAGSGCAGVGAIRKTCGWEIRWTFGAWRRWSRDG